MKHTESYRRFIERVESTVEYKVDVAALGFVDELLRCMRQAGVSQAGLARRLNASEPYVSKVLRGDTNFTLTTLVKLADAVGQDLHLHLAVPGSTVHWRDVITTSHEEAEWPQTSKACGYRQVQATGGGVNAELPVAA